MQDECQLIYSNFCSTKFHEFDESHNYNERIIRESYIIHRSDLKLASLKKITGF